MNRKGGTMDDESIDDLTQIEIEKGVKKLQLLDLVVPGFEKLPIAELMAVPFSLTTTVAAADQQQNQQLSGRQAFLWTHVALIATESDVSWVLEDSFYQGKFTFDGSQIRMRTLSGLGNDQDNKTPTPLPCAIYFPSNTSLTMFVTDITPAANNDINITLLGMKVRRGSGFHAAILRRMQYIGMGSPETIGATEE